VIDELFVFKYNKNCNYNDIIECIASHLFIFIQKKVYKKI